MSVARVYAKAALAAAKDDGKDAGSRLEQEMESMLTVFHTSKEAEMALCGPVTTFKEKTDLIKEFGVKLSLSDLMVRFLMLLAKKRRLGSLNEIREAFNEVRLEAEGCVPGRLTTAEQVDQSYVESLALAFGRKLGKKVVFRVSTDPSLLAGMKVTVNGVTYDGTLRSQLRKLHDRLVFISQGVAQGASQELA